MVRSTTALLGALERVQSEFGGDATARKRQLIVQLGRRRCTTVAQLTRLHEVASFIRAYPDDRAVLTSVEALLGTFHRRADLRRFAPELVDSGIAGSEIRFRFYWPTARWLATQWPRGLVIDWDAFDHQAWLLHLLPLLLPYTETLALDELDREPRAWIAKLKARQETDAAFLVRRVANLEASDRGRELLYDALDVPMRLQAGAGTPSRTQNRWAGARIAFQHGPIDRTRPDLRVDAQVAPRSIRAVNATQGQRLIDLARAAMVTRSRDLDAFCNADARAVRIVDCGDGLCFALMGVVPERRLMLESSYGALTLKNGLPIGYVLLSAAFGTVALAYNVFDTFRGGEAARVFGRVVAMARQVFGVDAFSIDPYQLGDGNDEGLRSGAWWFYQKLGFRPADRAIQQRMRRELARMQKSPAHRSSLATMRELVADSMYFYLDAPRDDVLGKVSLGDIGAAASRLLATRFGSHREEALRTCTAQASRLLGIRSTRGWSRGEKLWLTRWSPLLLAIRGIAKWSAAERAAAVAVVRAKGARHESEFVRSLDAHAKLRAGLLALA